MEMQISEAQKGLGILTSKQDKFGTSDIWAAESATIKSTLHQFLRTQIITQIKKD